MNNYSNPMVTYDEIVDALKAIIDCAKANGYIEEYGFLNVKYDSLDQNPIQKEQEQVLIQALQSLEKTIDNANKVIRENLKQELERLDSKNMFTIFSNYEHGSEKRKLASSEDLIIKLKEMSLPIEVFNKLEIVEEMPTVFEEIVDEENVKEIEIETVVQEEVENTIIEEEVTEIKENNKPELYSDMSKVDINKIQVIKSALDKARENGNNQLASVLEQQLLKEIQKLD